MDLLKALVMRAAGVAPSRPPAAVFWSHATPLLVLSPVGRRLWCADARKPFGDIVPACSALIEQRLTATQASPEPSHQDGKASSCMLGRWAMNIQTISSMKLPQI